MVSAFAYPTAWLPLLGALKAKIIPAEQVVVMSLLYNKLKPNTSGVAGCAECLRIQTGFLRSRCRR